MSLLFSGLCFATSKDFPLSAVPVAAGDTNKEQTRANEKPRYLRLKLIRILDKTAFVEDAEAARLLVPADWTFEGEVIWHPENRGCPDPENIVSITFRAISPGGTTSFEKLPNAYWIWLENKVAADAERLGQCTLREPGSPQDYIARNLLPQIRPGARILTSESLPQMSRIVKDMLSRMPPSLYVGVRQTSNAESARVLYELRERGGTARESIIGTQVTVLEQKPIYDPTGNHSLQKYENIYVVHASDFYAARSAQTEPDLGSAAIARILLSIHVNERWIAGRKEVASLLRHNKQLPEGVIPRVKLPEASESHLHEASAKERAEFRLHFAKAYDPGAVAVEDFLDPKTNQRITLNGGFAFAWANKDEFILTNDPEFNPATEFKENWTQLNRVAPQVP